MTPLEFGTDRLTVSHWRDALSDPAARVELEADLAAILTPPVLRPLPEPLQLGDGTVAAWIDARAAEAEVCTIRDRHGAELLGLLILAEMPEACHVGYLFAERAWGRGLATELLRGLIAVRRPGAAPLVAGVGTDNPASARVLRKAGFKRDAVHSDTKTEIFSCPGSPD